jgi:hypothetical protein
MDSGFCLVFHDAPTDPLRDLRDEAVAEGSQSVDAVWDSVGNSSDWRLEVPPPHRFMAARR